MQPEGDRCLTREKCVTFANRTLSPTDQAIIFKQTLKANITFILAIVKLSELLIVMCHISWLNQISHALLESHHEPTCNYQYKPPSRTLLKWLAGTEHQQLTVTSDIRFRSGATSDWSVTKRRMRLCLVHCQKPVKSEIFSAPMIRQYVSIEKNWNMHILIRGKGISDTCPYRLLLTKKTSQNLQMSANLIVYQSNVTSILAHLEKASNGSQIWW